MTRKIRVLIIIAVSLIALAFLANLAVDNPYSHQLIRNAINSKLAEKSNLEMDFRALSLNFLPLGVGAYGVSLKLTDSTLKVAETSRMRLSIAWSSLFIGQLKLSTIRFHELRLSYPLADEVEINWAENAGAAQENELPMRWPPNIRVPFSRIVLVDSSILYRVMDDEKNFLLLSLDGINLDWTVEGWQQWDLELDINRFNLYVEEKHLLRDALISTKLIGQNHQIHSKYFQIKSHRLDVNGLINAELELLERKFDPLGSRLFYQNVIGFKLQQRFKIERGDLGILGDYLGASQSNGDVSGLAKFTLQLPFDHRQPSWSIRGRGQSHGAKLAGFKLLDSKIRFLINEQGFYFKEAEVFDGDRSLAEGHGEILFQEGVPIQFHISPHQLPFQTLMSILQVEGFDPIQMELNGQDLILSGKALPFQLRLVGTGHFHNITSPIIQYKKPLHPLGPLCSMNIDLRIDAKQLSLQKADGYCSLAKNQQLKMTAGAAVPLQQKLSPLQLAGKFHFDTKNGLDFQIDLQDADAKLSQHFTNIKTDGKLQVKAHLLGPYDQFQIQLAADSKQFSLWDHTYENLSFRGIYQSKSRTLELITAEIIQVDDNFLKLSGSQLQFQDQVIFQGQIAANQISRETLDSWLLSIFPDLELGFGIRRLEAKINGPIDQMDQLMGHMDAELGEITYQKERLLSILRFTLTRDKQGLKIPSIYGRIDLLELQGQLNHEHQTPYQKSGNPLFATLGLGKKDPIKISLQSSQISSHTDSSNLPSKSEWNHFASLPYIGSILKEIPMGGDMMFQTDLDGTIERLDGQIQGSFENLFVFGSPIASVSFSGFIRGSRIELPVLRHSGNALIGRLTFDFLAPGIPYEWYFDLNQFDFRALFSPTFAKDPRNYAYISAFWQMRGHMERWWESKGEIRIATIAMNYINEVLDHARKIELTTDKEIAFLFDKNGWNFAENKALKLDGEHFYLELKTEKNLPPHQLNVSFQSSIALEGLRQLLPQIETARGQILLDGSLTGSVNEPNFQLAIRDRKLDPFKSKDWEPVSLGLADFPPAFTNIGIDANFDNGILRVQRVTANKGQQGTILVTGNLNLSDDIQTQSRLLAEIERMELNRLDIPLLNAADATLSGTLNLSGSSFPFRLAGDITLDRVHSIGNFDLRKQIIQALYRKRYSAPLTTKAAILDLDVEVSADKTIYIRNRNMEATLSADLRIQGSESEPIILGQIATESGSFIYKRNFDISRGFISFDEPTSPPDPKLDIIGEVQVDSYNVEVSIGGTASDPRVTFGIDPPTRPDGTTISNVDIIVLLTSGQLPSNSDTSPLRVASNEALSLFVGFAEGPLEKIFDASGQSFVRQVYIDSYLSETESRPITRLNLPIHINDDLRLVIQVDDDENFKQSFQYSLHENIDISGSIDKKKEDKSRNERNLPADTVLDLKFRFKFD